MKYRALFVLFANFTNIFVRFVRFTNIFVRFVRFTNIFVRLHAKNAVMFPVKLATMYLNRSRNSSAQKYPEKTVFR